MVPCGRRLSLRRALAYEMAVGPPFARPHGPTAGPLHRPLLFLFEYKVSRFLVLCYFAAIRKITGKCALKLEVRAEICYFVRST